MVVARPEIGGLRELRGRRIGVENTALGAYMLARALQSGELARADVEIVRGNKTSDQTVATIYALIHTGLPGRGWTKGVSYGLIVWALRVVMWAFSTYMMTDLAPVTIGITVGTGLIECLILGVVIALIHGTGA